MVFRALLFLWLMVGPAHANRMACAYYSALLAKPPTTPPIAREIDPVALEQFIQAHDRTLQPAVRFLTQNIRRIPHKDFVDALRRSAEKFVAANPELMAGKPLVIFVPTSVGDTQGSNRWTTDLVLEMVKNGMPFPANFRVVHGEMDDLKEYLSANPDVHDIAYIDDQSLSGAQIERVTDELPSSKRTHLIVPYFTTDAEGQTDPRYRYNVENIPTVRELVKEQKPSKAIRESLKRAWPGVGGIGSAVLTYQDHSIPDGSPSPRGRRWKPGLFRGSVVDIEGNIINTVTFLPQHRSY